MNKTDKPTTLDKQLTDLPHCVYCYGVIEWRQELNGNQPDIMFNFCPVCGRRITPEFVDTATPPTQCEIGCYLCIKHSEYHADTCPKNHILKGDSTDV